MKHAFFAGMVALFSICAIPFHSGAQTKETALKTTQINEQTNKGDALLLNKHLVKQGYTKGKVLHAKRYDLTDEAGPFSVTVIAVEYTKTLANKTKTTAEFSRIVIQRGDQKEIFNTVEDDKKTYHVQEGSVIAKGAGCNPTTVAVALISTNSTCKNCVSKVKGCIDSNKGKVWKTGVCLVTSATVPCLSCVGNFAKLVSAVIACM